MLTSAASRRLPARWCDGARTEIRFILLGGRASAAVVPSASVMSCYWCSAFRATNAAVPEKACPLTPRRLLQLVVECVFRESTGVGAAQARCGIASSARIPGWADSRPTDQPVRRQRPFPTSPGESARPSRISTEPARSAARSARGTAPARPTPCDQPAAPNPFDWPSRSVCGRTRAIGTARPNPRDQQPAPDGTRRTARAGPHLRGQPASWLRDEQAAAVDVTTSGRMLANGAADGASASVRHDRPPHEPPR